MKVKGKLKEILKKESGKSKSGKDWEKQSFVIDTGSDFNNLICIDCFGDKIHLMSNLKIGAELEVMINVSSREYNGKYYHNINAWEINLLTGSVEVESNDLPF
tara:strand:+ start:1202 stop:1510 length:309 start_codon:yes stop_codon:yes gene_type:complete